VTKSVGRHNPSAWPSRCAVLVLALVAATIASYLALDQWRIVASVWDPLFGSVSSEAVLHSPISRMLPLPDALFGACAYLLEAVLAVLGGADRWRTRPWLVVIYAGLVVALALTGIVLVLSQVLLLHALCSLCLAMAGISFVNAALAREEVGAAFDVLIETHGGTAHEAQKST
jgi:uncharacterized membrane protein